MNIALLCSSPTSFLLAVIKSPIVVVCRFNWPQIVARSLLQVVHKNQVERLYHYGIDFVFLHVISQCPISYPNIIVCIDRFHLSLIHYWIQIQVSKDSRKHFYNFRTTLVMKNCNEMFLHPPCPYFIIYNY